jgi:hypothetical protein
MAANIDQLIQSINALVNQLKSGASGAGSKNSFATSEEATALRELKSLTNELSVTKLKNKDITQDELDAHKKLLKTLVEEVDLAIRNNELTDAQIDAAIKNLKTAKEILAVMDKQVDATEKRLLQEAQVLSFQKSITSNLSQKLGLSIKDDKIQKSISESLKNGSSRMAALGKGMKAYAIQAINSENTTNMLLKGWSMAYDRFKAVDEVVASTSRTMDLTRDQAFDLYNNYNLAAKASGQLAVTAKAMFEAQGRLNTQFGISGNYSHQMLEDMSVMEKNMKLEADIQADIAVAQATTGKEAGKVLKARLGEIAAANASMKTNINSRQVLKDMAAVSNTIRVNFWGNDAALAAAATKARALGVELNKMEGVASSMLNFETSIQSQMEAEVLTGKQMNLEELRYQSLYGTTADIATELAKQVGTAQDFQKMNRIQAEGYANALGMSREEISEMLLKQQAVNKFGKVEYDQKIELYKQAVKDGTLADFKQKQGEEAYEMLKGQLSNAEKQELIQEKIADQMHELVKVIKPISDAFTNMASMLAKSANVMTMIVRSFEILSAMKLVQFLLGGGLKTAASQINNVAKTVSSTAAPTGPGLAPSVVNSVVPKATTSAFTGIPGAVPQSAASLGATVIKPPTSLPSPTLTSPGGVSTIMPQTAGGVAAGAPASMASQLGEKSGIFSRVLGMVTKGGMKALKTVLKTPIIAGALETYFANTDIKGMIADRANISDEDLKQKVGARAMGGLGSIAGGLAGAGLVNLLNLVGIPGFLATAAAAAGGSMAGSYLMTSLANAVGAKGLGAAILSGYETEMNAAKRPKLDKGGVIKESGLVHADAGEVYTGSETINLFKGMYNEMKAQNEILMGILRKDTTLVVDNQVMAKATGRAAVTSYGNVLNNPKLH